MPWALQSDKTSGTVLGTHAYQTTYERHMGPYRNCRDRGELNLLEIGLGAGPNARSFHLYNRYFSWKHLHYHGFEIENKTARIAKFDLHTAAQKKYLIENVHLGDQGKGEDLSAATAKWGPFDMIVEDASHIVEHQISTLLHCFLKSLKPGGTYVVEDLQTSYAARWNGTLDKQRDRLTMVAMLQDLTAALSFDWWCHPAFNGAAAGGATKNTFGQDIDPAHFKLYPELLEWIETIEFDREICTLRKRTVQLVKTACVWPSA
jgi:hypothetical protein